MICSVCKQELPAEQFYEVKSRRNGKKDLAGNTRSSRCKQCQNQDYINLDPRKKMLYAARSRANKLKVACTITVNDIIIPEVCPVLGIALLSRVGGGRPTTDQIPNSPSLDRIVNSQGYVPGNVAVISFRANLLKRDATADEIRAILRYMEEHS